ncbi:MAG: hypothetical protein CMJ42_08115 [Phyllobacteriaceae bacterium]|nr:hypothetical protein [Phyllobacteriaceae bacterium]MBA89733.1 hypothetical protein [Phyllobacteriaceae bacterium]
MKPDQYARLAGTTMHVINVCKGRGFVPFLTKQFNYYSAWDSFTYRLAQHLAGSPDGLSLNRGVAVKTVRECALDIVASRDRLEAGEELLFGRITLRGFPAVPFVGSHEELAFLMEKKAGRGLHIQLSSLTACYQAFLAAAERIGAPVDDLWPEAETIPTAQEVQAEYARPLREAASTINTVRA